MTALDTECIDFQKNSGTAWEQEKIINVDLYQLFQQVVRFALLQLLKEYN